MHPSQYLPIIRRALEEDLGLAGDISAEAAVPFEAVATARIVARRSGRLAGLEVAGAVFLEVDPTLDVELLASDGDEVEAGGTIGRVSGGARSILSAERTALNLLGQMSGVATATARLVQAVAGTGVQVADTRKTTAGLRLLEKYAVRMGGGINHRFGLFDAVMIKDNHIIAAGGIRAAVVAARARVGHMVKIEVEVATLDQLAELLEVGADVVMLDNMDLATLREAVQMVAGQMVTEASGSITLDTVLLVAETGVDIVSAGSITHSAPVLDVALDFESGTAAGPSPLDVG
jgi:nicotinate-nucleotide pyrophosphorylase (carboxylating)